MDARNARRWWALGALTLAVLAVGLDATVLSVALPTLATDLHATTADLQWFVSAYTLVLAAALLPGGLLGDRYGRKKILLGALALFGAGSLACAYAPSAGAFIAARVLLGLGAAAIIPLALSVLTVLFTDQERPRAVGVWATANFLALPIGPILGGWLLTNYWWGWVFLINLPVVAVGLLAVAVLLPESRSATRTGLDPVGVLASSAGLAVLVYGVIEAGEHGWGDTTALAGMLAGALLLAGFVLWERRLGQRQGGQPLVDLGLFRSTSFTWGAILAAVGVFAMFGVLFTAPQYFQAILGTNAMGSGLRLLPLIGGLAVGAGSADRIAARAGAKLTVAAGFVLLAAGLALGATTSMSSGTGFLSLWTPVVGLGMGFALATASAAALGALPAERAGVGSAVMQAVNKVGAPFAAAILGSVLNATYRGRLDLVGVPARVAGAVRDSVFAGVAAARQLGSVALLHSVRAAFVAGMDLMLWACAAIAVAGIVLALVFLPGRTAAATTTEDEPAAKEDDVVIRAPLRPPRPLGALTPPEPGTRDGSR
jgi:DHA2 family multidrug resistance protein-like MFS transporter